MISMPLKEFVASNWRKGGLVVILSQMELSREEVWLFVFLD